MLTDKLWDDDTTPDRTRKCRRVGIVAGGAVGYRGKDGAAGYSGLAKCGSVWICPVCAAKIARERASDLQVVLNWAIEQGHTVVMLTLTAKHHNAQRLRSTWNAVTYGWESITSSRKYTGESAAEYQKRLDNWAAKGKKRKRPERTIGWKERHGELGWVRAVETTLGEANGWHPHLHVVMVIEGQVSGAYMQEAIRELFPIWQRALKRNGYDAQERWVNEDGSIGGALDVTCSTDYVEGGAVIAKKLSEYFTKMISLEVTHAVNKKGRNGGRTPFQLATDAFYDGDADAYDAWQEWVAASKGRQQLTWSKRLREMAGLSRVERTNEEIAEDNLGNADDLLLPHETWIKIRRHQVELLIAGENGGVEGAIAWLQARQLDYIDLRPAQRPGESAGVTDGRARSVPPATV